MSDNTTCYHVRAPHAPPPLIQDGKIVLQAHFIGWAVSAVFALIATIASGWLLERHCANYTNKREQRYILRLLLLPPLYALSSLAAYFFWDESTPIVLARDAYESIALYAFFSLLLTYVGPDEVAIQEEVARVGLSKDRDTRLEAECVRRRTERRRREMTMDMDMEDVIGQEKSGKEKKKGQDDDLKPEKWMWPMGFIRWKPRDGLEFLQWTKWGVLQYCVVRPTSTLAAIILNYLGLYCEDSWSPKWGHVYITLIISISVSVAMYFLIQLYIALSSLPQLEGRRVLLQLGAVKAVVFLTFWQSTLLGVLSMFGVVKDTEYMTADDINIGWGAIAETFEMVIFAFLHIKAFSYKPYARGEPQHRHYTRLGALAHAFDPRPTFRELHASTIYAIERVRGDEPRRNHEVRRRLALERAFGHARPAPVSQPTITPFDLYLARRNGEGEEEALVKEEGECKPIQIAVDVEVDVHRDLTESSLVHAADNRAGRDPPGLLLARGMSRLGVPGIDGEKTDTLGAQIGAELSGKHGKGRSWWRGLYDRVSRTSDHQEFDDAEARAEEEGLISGLPHTDYVRRDPAVYVQQNAQHQQDVRLAPPPPFLSNTSSDTLFFGRVLATSPVPASSGASLVSGEAVHSGDGHQVREGPRRPTTIVEDPEAKERVDSAALREEPVMGPAAHRRSSASARPFSATVQELEPAPVPSAHRRESAHYRRSFLGPAPAAVDGEKESAAPGYADEPKPSRPKQLRRVTQQISLSARQQLPVPMASSSHASRHSSRQSVRAERPSAPRQSSSRSLSRSRSRKRDSGYGSSSWPSSIPAPPVPPIAPAPSTQRGGRAAGIASLPEPPATVAPLMVHAPHRITPPYPVMMQPARRSSPSSPSGVPPARRTLRAAPTSSVAGPTSAMSSPTSLVRSSPLSPGMPSPSSAMPIAQPHSTTHPRPTATQAPRRGSGNFGAFFFDFYQDFYDQPPPAPHPGVSSRFSSQRPSSFSSSQQPSSLVQVSDPRSTDYDARYDRNDSLR